MTAKLAQQKGYSFTGIYSSYNVAEVRARVAELKKKGFRVVLVPENNGLSAYAEPAYFIAQQLRDAETALLRIPADLLALKAKYDADVAALHEQATRLNGTIADCKLKLTNPRA